MRTLKIMAGAMLLAGVATPAIADDHDDMMELSAQQQSMYDGWSAEQQTSYDAWPMEAQTYYWTLDDMQKDIWWNALNDAQRVRIVGMNDQQRMAAWQSIRSQMAGSTNATTPNSTTANTGATNTATTGNTGMETRSSSSKNSNIRFVENAMVQNIPAPHNGEYPPCKDGRTDNCINPREAGLNYGNRPLDYWPGQPASQAD